MVKNRVDPRTELPSQISDLADKICLKINDIETMEEELKNAKSEKDNWMKEMGELLDSSGYTIGSVVILKNGRKMKLKEFFSANLPSKSTIESCKDAEKQAELEFRKEKGLKWLDDNGMGDVIKNNITAILPRGNQSIAKQVSSYLVEMQVPYVREESVHAMTLNATIKDAMKNGMNVPFETFNIITGTIVEIK